MSSVSVGCSSCMLHHSLSSVQRTSHLSFARHAPTARPAGLQLPRLQRRCCSTVKADSSAQGWPGTSASFMGLSILTAAHAASRLISPSVFMELTCAACPTAALGALIQLSAATTIPAVAALWSLKEAAEHNRLGSDTYKRLSLGLILWQCVTIGLALCTPALDQVYRSALVGYGITTSLVCGHAYVRHSGRGFRPIVEAVHGFVANLKSLCNNRTIYSTIFSFVAVLAPVVAMLFLVDPKTFFQPTSYRIFGNYSNSFGSFFMRSVGANMLLASSFFFSLKDAEDRGRSGATTFRLLSMAALVTGGVEVAIFASSGAMVEAMRELLFCILMGSFLLGS